MIHEDERRTLEDWPEAKIITAKTDCILGNHYHKLKIERFVLISGQATMTKNGWTERMEKGELYTVNPLERHSFELLKGSILIGLCSQPFDPNDDYK